MNNIEELMKMDPADLAELLDVDEDLLMHLADVTRRVAVLDAVVATASTDVDELALWIYHDKGETAPVEFCAHVVEEYLPILEEDGMIFNGQATDEGILVSAMHQAMLHQDVTMN
jgi:hypothetical protein